MIKDSFLKRPIITEKTLSLAKKGIFSFFVPLCARKTEIKNEIEKVFNVHVEKINTVKIKGKRKRVGKKRLPKETQDIKKALVKLRKGEKIDLFEVEEAK